MSDVTTQPRTTVKTLERQRAELEQKSRRAEGALAAEAARRDELADQIAGAHVRAVDEAELVALRAAQHEADQDAARLRQELSELARADELLVRAIAIRGREQAERQRQARQRRLDDAKDAREQAARAVRKEAQHLAAAIKELMRHNVNVEEAAGDATAPPWPDTDWTEPLNEVLPEIERWQRLHPFRMIGTEFHELDGLLNKLAARPGTIGRFVIEEQALRRLKRLQASKGFR